MPIFLLVFAGGERPRAGEDQEDREDQSQDSAASGSHSTGLWLFAGLRLIIKKHLLLAPGFEPSHGRFLARALPSYGGWLLSLPLLAASTLGRNNSNGHRQHHPEPVKLIERVGVSMWNSFIYCPVLPRLPQK